MNSTDEKFQRFCSIWNVQSWPDIGHNLTYSNYSRRNYDHARRQSMIERDENFIVPVCEGVYTLPGVTMQRRRSTFSIYNTLEDYEMKQNIWKKVIQIRNRGARDKTDHAADLLKQFKEYSLRICLSQSLRILTNKTIEHLQENEKDIIEANIDNVHEDIRPDPPEFWERLQTIHEHQVKECEKASELEKNKLKSDMTKQIVRVETAFRDRKRKLEDDEKEEIATNQEIELFVREESVLKNAYQKPKLPSKFARRDR